jgi:hypothetical protein
MVCVVEWKKDVLEIIFSFTMSTSSSFVGWSAKNIVGRLTKAEVIGCLPLGWIRPMDARKWDVLEDVILKLSDEMKRIIYEAGHTKDHVIEETRREVAKKKIENFQWVRRTRRRLDKGMLF